MKFKAENISAFLLIFQVRRFALNVKVLFLSGRINFITLNIELIDFNFTYLENI